MSFFNHINAILLATLGVALFSATWSDAQTVPTLSMNTSTIGVTPEISDTIFQNFAHTDITGTVGNGGQLLYQFTIEAKDNSTDIRLSTCDGSGFDTYLVLFDRDPRDIITATVNGTTVAQNVTAVAESANDILCKESITRATIMATLTEGTYYVLVTGDGGSHGTFNLTLNGTPKFQRTAPVWHLDRIDQRYLPMDNDYSVTTTAEDVLVYLIDSGVNVNHEEFEGRAKVGYDFVRYADDDTPDCTGHGTHVAGLIAGKTFGVAKKSEIVSLRVYGCSNRASLSAIVNALHWVLAHSKSNCYLGRCVVALMVANGNGPSPGFESVLRGFVRRQIPVIVPAGDHNSVLADEGDACSIFPANNNDFISVGATTRTDNRAAFSNSGSCVDLHAPGSRLQSAWHTSNTATLTMSGTAQAASIVTGVAAVLLSINNGLPAPDVKNILTSVSTPNIASLTSTQEKARLVYVRSVPTGPREIPPDGHVLLQMEVQTKLSSCEAGKTRFESFRAKLSEVTLIEESGIVVSCESAVPVEPVASVFRGWRSPVDASRIVPSLPTKQGSDFLYSVNVKLTVIERKASVAFLRLEQVLKNDKAVIEEEFGFSFDVSVVPWAIDSREVIYWGAPTFPASEPSKWSIGIIIALIMSLIVILSAIGVTAWLWYRRVMRKDEIESMVGSVDMEKGPVTFCDFDDDESPSLQKTRSFRKVGGSSRASGGGSSSENSGGNAISSMSSFVNQGEPQEGTSIRLHSYGPEAFAGINFLDSEDDKEAREAEDDKNWRLNAPGRMNSMVSTGEGDEDQVSLDEIRVQSMGGEAFAMLANMGSLSDIGVDVQATDEDGP